MKIFILISLILLLLCNNAKSASAVAFNSSTGAWATSANRPTVVQAEEDALSRCPGGCIIYSGIDKGYWTIATSGPVLPDDQSPHLIGCAYGQKTPHDAQVVAYNSCCQACTASGTSTDKVARDGGAPWYEEGQVTLQGEGTMSFNQALLFLSSYAHGESNYYGSSSYSLSCNNGTITYKELECVRGEAPCTKQWTVKVALISDIKKIQDRLYICTKGYSIEWKTSKAGYPTQTGSTDNIDCNSLNEAQEDKLKIALSTIVAKGH